MSKEKKKVCMLCGRPSDDIICDACKADIQGEALEKKRRIDKGVRVDREVPEKEELKETRKK